MSSKIFTVLSWTAPRQNNCRSNSVGEPVTEADISHEKPLKLLGVSNSTCDRCKSFHKVGTGSISIDIRCHLFSFVTVPRLKEAGENKCDFFPPLYKCCLCILLKHHAGWMWQVVSGAPSTAADFPVHVPSVGHNKKTPRSHTFLSCRGF